jgi:hypothetical protein
MRVVELLAIVAICPLGVVDSGCGRVDQPIGQYRASTTRTSSNNTAGSAQGASQGTQNEPSRTTDSSAGDASTSEEFDPINNSLPNPVFPSEPSTGSETPPSGMTNVRSVPAMCLMGSTLATRKPLDMYLVVDANVTLPYSGSWEVATRGIRLFAQDPASEGVGVGLRYYGSECEAEPYDLEPTVEVRALPANEDELVAATMMDAEFSASPMAPALEGGIRHQKERAKQYPERTQIVVMITDGFTQDLQCRYSLQDVQDQAYEGFNSNPQVETYVIGFGAPDTMSTFADELLSRFSGLNGVARDGGSSSAFSVKFNDEPETMHEKLVDIRRRAQPCAYKIPSNADVENLNLSIADNFVSRRDSRAACRLDHGFFYGPEGADTPTTAELCPVTCALLRDRDFEALFYHGCPTVRR